MTNQKNYLDHSYQIDSVEKTQAYYSEWAATYDAEIIANGYASPQRYANALAKFVDDKNLHILDIGCGTGLSGKILAETGFTQIDGCDINPEMLEISKSRKIYQHLWLSNPEDPFTFKAGKYDAITAVGVIGAGAAPLSLLHETLKMLVKDGLFIFSFNDHTLEDPSYVAAINKEVDKGKFELLFKEYGAHLPGRDIKSNVYVLRKI